LAADRVLSGDLVGDSLASLIAQMQLAVRRSASYRFLQRVRI